MEPLAGYGRVVAMTKQSEIFHGLDVLRGYAAIIVVIYHARSRIDAPILSGGYLAVDLFFLMSGFVIAHSYDQKLPYLGFWGFLRARAIRLYPLYVLGTAIGLFVILAIWHFGKARSFGLTEIFSALVLNLLFIPSPSRILEDNLFPFVVPAWSLMFEMIINLAYALLFAQLTTRVLTAVIVISGAFVIVHTLQVGHSNGGATWDSFAMGLARVSFSFPLGVMLYRHRTQLPRLGWLGILTLPSLLVALQAEPSPLRDLLFILVLSPLLAMVCADYKPRWHSLASYLAATSYCIYIVHHPILLLTSSLARRLEIESTGPIAAAVIILLISCYFIDRFYDRPLRRWLNASRAGSVAHSSVR